MADRTGKPALATRRRAHRKPGRCAGEPHLARNDHYGIVGHAMMSSPDLLTGLGRLIRYLRIVSDAAAISLVTEQGARWVRLDLQDGSPRRPQIASDLSVSDHTFQRRLSDEGTSFTELVDETRRELAHRHLSDPQTSLSEIVYLLGYSDLFRAYLR